MEFFQGLVYSGFCLNMIWVYSGFCLSMIWVFQGSVKTNLCHCMRLLNCSKKNLYYGTTAIYLLFDYFNRPQPNLLVEPRPSKAISIQMIAALVVQHPMMKILK